MGKKSHVEEPGSQQQMTRLNHLLLLQRQNDIISMILEGKEPKEISKYIMEKYRTTQTSVNTYISYAREEIKKRKNYEVNNLVTIHIARYEDLYRRMVPLGAHRLSLKVLDQKEKLLGFHKEGFHMRVSQGSIMELQVGDAANNYDISKLTEEKRKRLEELLIKAKRQTKKEIE